MYYETFRKLCDERGVRPGTVGRHTGIPTATMTSWKQGKYTPKQDKLQRIAEFFDVTLEYLMGKEPEKESERNQYYINPRTAEIAQAVFDDPDLMLLFEAARDVKPENIRLAAEMLRRFKDMSDD